MLCIQKENYCSALFTHESGWGNHNGPVPAGHHGTVDWPDFCGGATWWHVSHWHIRTVLALQVAQRRIFSSENVEIITVTVRIDSPIYYETKSLRGSNRVTRFAITGKTKDKQFETVALRSSSKRTPIATLHAMTRISAARQLGYGL